MTSKPIVQILQIPLQRDPPRWMNLRIDTPLTEEGWERMLTVLGLCKGAIVPMKTQEPPEDGSRTSGCDPEGSQMVPAKDTRDAD